MGNETTTHALPERLCSGCGALLPPKKLICQACGRDNYVPGMKKHYYAVGNKVFLGDELYCTCRSNKAAERTAKSLTLHHPNSSGI